MVIGIIIGLIFLLVILIVVLNRESSTPEPEPVPKPEPKPKPVQLPSLDAVYAEKNGLWVCKYCETLNQKGSLSCGACGENR